MWENYCLFNMRTYAQIKAIESKQKKKVLSHFPFLTEGSGIYIMTREENGFKYAYVGQAKHILSRIVQHIMEYKLHIDMSLKKHGLYDDLNPGGWKIVQMEFPETILDEKEREYIRRYADMGFQMRNKTSGGQDKGKSSIGEKRAPKGYREGVARGYENARKDVSQLFEKNLTYGINGKPNKLKERALEKFNEFLKKD